MSREESSELDLLLGALPRRRRRHGLSLLLLAVALALALALLARLLYGTSSPFYTVPVERGDLTPRLVARGTLHGAGEVTLPAARDGTVVAMADPGQAWVRAGQVLVTMDTAATARALAADTGDATVAQDAANRAQTALQEARQRLDRFESVWRKTGGKVPSLNEMEAARADVARRADDLADAQVRGNEAAQRVARDRADLDDAMARAPFTGFLQSCQVQPGQAVHVGQPLCTVIAHPDRLSVVVPVGETDRARLAAGVMAQVLADGSTGAEFTARLTRIDRSQEGRSQEGRSQGGAGWVAVFQLLPPAAEEAAPMPMPGLGATLRIALPEREDVLLVPDAALGFRLHGRARLPGVYVTRDSGVPRFVPVAVGADDGRRSEVLSGDLTPGDQVIIGWRRERQAGS